MMPMMNNLVNRTFGMAPYQAPRPVQQQPAMPVTAPIYAAHPGLRMPVAPVQPMQSGIQPTDPQQFMPVQQPQNPQVTPQLAAPQQNADPNYNAWLARIKAAQPMYGGA